MRFVPLIFWLGVATGGTTYYFATRPVQESLPPPASRESSSEGIGLPIAGLRMSDIQDTYAQTRGGARQHDAVDILAPRGTPVHAVVDGVVKKLFLSKPGGITVYQFDVREEMSYYYAHLDRYVDGLKEGQFLKRGEVLGYVGYTGNADTNTPHLHFAIFELKPDKKWWEGTPLNPYPLLMKALRAESAL